jgi:hypothetical protein
MRWTITQRSVMPSAPTWVAHLEVGGRADEVVGEGDLGAPGPPGVVHDGLVGRGSVPVTVTVLVGAVQVGGVLAGHDSPKPRPFHLGQVADQAEQRHGRGGMERRASCSGSSPAHFISSVSRYGRRNSSSVGRSSTGSTSVSRGSSSGSTHMSGLTVAAAQR